MSGTDPRRGAPALAGGRTTGGESGPVRGAVARSALWSLAESGGLALVSFTTLIILARYLSPSDFGLFSIVLAVIEVLGVVVSMLFHDALIQRENVTDLHFDTAFTATAVLSLLLLGACWLFAPVFSDLVADPSAGWVLAWTALALPLAATSAAIAARQRREFQFRVLALRSLLGRVSGAVLGVALAFLGFGYWSLVGQQVLMAAMGSLVLWLGVVHPPRLRFGRREATELVGFGWMSLAFLLLTYSVKRIFVIVAGVLLGTEAAGYLNVGFRLVDVLWAVAATAVTQVVLPVLSRLQRDPERLRDAYAIANEFACTLLYPVFFGIAIVAPELVEVLLGLRWMPSAHYVACLALLIIVQAPRLMIVPVLQAKGLPGWTLVGPGVELLVVAFLIGVFGLPSALSAVTIWIIRELVSWPIMAYLLKAKGGISLVDQLRGTVTPALAALAMMLAALAVRHALGGQAPPLVRLVAIGGTTSLAFVCLTTLLNRPSLMRLWLFFDGARMGRGCSGSEEVGRRA